ncbi:MAG TPA: hypothetical protein VF683_04755 [Chthoniobacterales bacterium]
MRIIRTFVHGIIDYVAGMVFFFAPEIFGFADGPGSATMIARVAGVVSLVYALSTNYELGVVKFLSMRAHLIIDYLMGLLFLVSPFAFGFINGPKHQWLPHICFGVFALAAGLTTKKEPTHGAVAAHVSATPRT